MKCGTVCRCLTEKKQGEGEGDFVVFAEGREICQMGR